MRRLAWMLLLLFAFAIPWEYSLDLGAPWGNIARLAGLALLAVMLPAVLQTGRIRPPAPFHIAVLLWLLWLCCSALWSIVASTTVAHLPGYFEEAMIAWFLWELVESDADLASVLRAYVAGAAVLAFLTLASFLWPQSPDLVRFVPAGQDPNDVARYLVLGLPLAAWLLNEAEARWQRVALGSLMALTTVAVLLTASRGGFLACAISLIGCGVVLWRRHLRIVLAGLLMAPAAVLAVWLAAPHDTLLRLAGIPAQLMAGDLNQRWEIWTAGWRAFARAPLLGSGAGSFVWAARLAPSDTAHNTALAIAAEGGLIALTLVFTILVLCFAALRRARLPLRLSLGTALAAWMSLSLVSTLQENRTTWLLLGLIVVAGRLGRPSAVVLAGERVGRILPEPAEG
ncbi:MAG: O-antigen ligase family protein [Acidobacteriota bacterium]